MRIPLADHLDPHPLAVFALSVRLGMIRREHKQPGVRGRRAKEGGDIDHDVCPQLKSARDMVDGRSDLITHDQGVLLQGFGAVDAAFLQARHTCAKTVVLI
jgi:hypothetical protein